MAEAVPDQLSPAEPESPSAALTDFKELYTQEQLAEHARRLAAAHRVTRDRSRAKPLLPELEASADDLEHAYQFLSAIARTDTQPVPAEDWLRDNYHVVQDQIREVRRDLPKKFYIELPKLGEGPSAGQPRVYPIACELILHTAGRLDLETLIEFVTAYQQISPLSIGEIWAIPI